VAWAGSAAASTRVPARVLQSGGVSAATDTTRALLRACHPGPAFAVTVLTVLLAMSWDTSAGTALLVGAAALSGQLSVGWSNDLVDRHRDRVVGRQDKPLVTGAVRVSTVRRAVAVALVLTVVTSLALGPAPGFLHLGLVAAGWAYNLGVKRSVLSWLPYAVCFGCLPLVVSLAVRGEGVPAWMPVAGALLGTGAHLVNAVPDLEDDRVTGVNGLPHRLGARWSLDLATILLLAGSAVVVLVPAGPVGTAGLATLTLVVVLVLIGRVAPGRGAFHATIGVALVDVIALLARS
jgi:4-hydroxybenzoate polyprenyltransferase